MLSYKIIVKDNTLRNDIYYKEQLILKYTIKYPAFISQMFHVFLNELNLYYRTKALLYEKFNIMKLYQMAVEDYENSIANGYPVHVYEAFTDYQVTYNQNCLISLYFDQYEYTGGAHGSTIRYSNTWSLMERQKLSLSDLFQRTIGYQDNIINIILNQINKEIESGNNIYFEDYSNLVKKNFNKENFYLTEEGVVIYFQQYDIAPYSSGILTFIIPYSSNLIDLPYCFNVV